MLLDKSLILKGVAGVAVVGGVATTGVALKEGTALNKLLFSSSKPKENDDQAKEVKKDPGEDQDAVRSGAADVKDETVVTDSSTPESKEDAYGIPKRCNDSSKTPCDLTQDELKKIKFEVLGDEKTPDVTVEHFPSQEDQKITLTIDSIDASKKKYIFSNTSTQEVNVKRGDDKTVTLKVGKTKFTIERGKLKERELGDYGEPKNCTQSCTLTSTDLEDIKFKDLEEGTDPITIAPDTGTVSLEIKNIDNTKRYIFSSSSQDVTISKGEDKKVILTSNKKSQFTGSENKLSKLALDTYGVPSSCSTSETCTLTADDLGEIKFEELDGSGTVSPNAGNVTLKIDSSDTTNKRFTFNNSSNSAITIKNSSGQTVTLSPGKNRFKENGGKLKEIKLDSYGLPADCTQSCKLTEDDLKEVKFPGFEGQSGDVTVNPPNQTITFTKDTSKNQYSFQNSGSEITIKKGSVTIKLTEEQATMFYEEEGKMVKTTAIDKLNEMLNKAGFPDEDSCKLKDGNTTVDCKLDKNKFLKLKFKGWKDNDEMEESQITIEEGSQITAKIEKDGGELKITFSGINNSMSIDSKSGTPSTFYLNNNYECTINSENRIEKKGK